MPDPANELLTTADFARIANVVPDTVRAWERLGKITPAFRTPSGLNLYRREEAERIARERAAQLETRSVKRQDLLTPFRH